MDVFFFNGFLPHLSGKPPPIPLPFNPSAAQHHAFAFPIPDLRGRGVGGGLITYNEVTRWKETIRPCSITGYPQKGEPYSFVELVDRVLKYDCDITLAGRYDKTRPQRFPKLTLRGRHGAGSYVRECFQVVCQHTVCAKINLDKMQYVFEPQDSGIWTRCCSNLFRDRIKFLMEYFLCGTMTNIKTKLGFRLFLLKKQPKP